MCEASLTKSLVDAARKQSSLPSQVTAMPSSGVPKLVDQFFDALTKGEARETSTGEELPI